MISKRKELAKPPKRAYYPLKKRPKAANILKGRVKTRLCRLFNESTDIELVREEMMEIVVGLAKKELNKREVALHPQIKATREDILKLRYETTSYDHIISVQKSELRDTGLYLRLINASSLSELVPASGLIQDEDRKWDLLFRKHYEGRSDLQTESMKIGLAAEEIVFEKVNRSTHGNFVKCSTFINLTCPWLCATPDGIWKKDNRVHAVLEIKTITTEDTLYSLNKGSDMGVLLNKETLELEHRLNSKSSQQIQLQMLCSGAQIGYFVVYDPKSGDTTTKKIDRNDELLASIIDNSRAKFVELLPRAEKIWNAYMNPLKRDIKELTAMGQLLTIDIPETKMPQKSRSPALSILANNSDDEGNLFS